MCEAEDDLRRAEREIEWWAARLDMVIELAADVERGIIDLPEFRREAEALKAQKGIPSYA